MNYFKNAHLVAQKHAIIDDGLIERHLGVGMDVELVAPQVLHQILVEQNGRLGGRSRFRRGSETIAKRSLQVPKLLDVLAVEQVLHHENVDFEAVAGVFVHIANAKHAIDLQKVKNNEKHFFN